MACRKAAYRAMTEMSEWMEREAEQEASRKEAMEKEQRLVWTPSNFFDQCCTAWLAEGPEILGHKNGRSTGCSGVCGKEHPRVTLDFEHQASASLSIQLDPFVQYFDSLCDHGLAIKNSSNMYYLVGFLESHIERLKQSAPFGSHLVKVSPAALMSSKRAQLRQRELDEVEQDEKKRKTRGASASNDLLSRVMDVCHFHLLDYLDLVDIAWMRLSCKILGKHAAKLASVRLMKLRLSCSIRTKWMPLDPGHFNETTTSSRSFESTGTDMMYSYSLPSTEKPGTFAPESPDQLRLEHSVVKRVTSTRLDNIVRKLVLTAYDIDVCLLKDDLFSEPVVVGRVQIALESLVDGAHKSGNLSYRVKFASPDQTTESDERSVCIHQISVNFDFSDLLTFYVREKLPLAKKELKDMSLKTRKAKDYVKALAKEARTLGSARPIEQLIAW